MPRAPRKTRPPMPDLAPVETVNEWLGEAVRLTGLVDNYDEVHTAAMVALAKRREEVVGEMEGRLKELNRQIEAWHRASFAAGKVTATLNLPYGTIALGPEPRGTSTVEDSEALLAWAECNAPEAVKPPGLPTVDLTILRSKFSTPTGTEPNSEARLITDSGEVVPGVVVKVGERSWRIK